MNQDKPKHTDGPWIIEDARQHRKCYGGTVREEDWRFGLCIRAKDSCHLATVGHVDKRHYEDAKANAQLMGSAPELLAALEKLTALAANQLDQSATHDGLENCKALADARKAIAKGRGRTPQPEPPRVAATPEGSRLNQARFEQPITRI